MNSTLNTQAWLFVWQKLHSINLQPLPTETEINTVLNQLPEREENESFSDWLKRRKTTVVPFNKYKVTKLTELRLKAAKSSLSQYPLPEQPRVTPNGAFRFTLSQDETKTRLNVHIKALALAIAKYKNKYIGISSSDNLNEVIVCIQLNQHSEGSATVADNETMRKILCVNPVFVLIESDDV